MRREFMAALESGEAEGLLPIVQEAIHKHPVLA
jgi:hypothetical protein